MGPHCSLHHCSLHQVTKHLRVKKLPTRAATSGMKCKKTPPVPAKPPVWPFASRMGKVASNVPKPRRPYKSMDQAKLVKKHGEMHQKLQLAQKRMENVKTKFDRFDAERKLRATVATHDENAQAVVVTTFTPSRAWAPLQNASAKRVVHGRRGRGSNTSCAPALRLFRQLRP